MRINPFLLFFFLTRKEWEMQNRKTMASSWVLCTKHNDKNSCLTFWKLWQFLEPTALLSEPHRLNNCQQYFLKLLKIFKFPDYLWKVSVTYFGNHPAHMGCFFIKEEKDHWCSEGFSHCNFNQLFLLKSQNCTFSIFKRCARWIRRVWRTRDICKLFWPAELRRQVVHFSSALFLLYPLALSSLCAKE